MDNPKAKEMGQKFPLLPHWMTRYGSSDSYDHPIRYHRTEHGEYVINPLFDKAGTLSGYGLKFAHTGKGKQQALWHDLGVHSHPGRACARACKHADSMKNESLNEEEREEVLSNAELEKSNRLRTKGKRDARKSDRNHIRVAKAIQRIRKSRPKLP